LSPPAATARWQLRTALEQARSAKADAAPLTQEQKLAQWEQLKVESTSPHA